MIEKAPRIPLVQSLGRVEQNEEGKGLAMVWLRGHQLLMMCGAVLSPGFSVLP